LSQQNKQYSFAVRKKSKDAAMAKEKHDISFRVFPE